MPKSKPLLLLVVATIVVLGSIAYVESATRPRERALQVDGMVCDGCAEHLKDALIEIPGVQSVAVSHEQSQATVTVAGWTQPSDEALLHVVQESGYSGSVRE